MLTLRATRTLRPERSISISVRLVSSSSDASPRMSVLSSEENFAAGLSSGWRAMILIPENSVRVGGRERQASASSFGLGPDFGGKTVDCEPVSIDSKAGKCRKGGHGGEGVV